MSQPPELFIEKSVSVPDAHEIVAYYSKGHHDPDAFLAELDREYDVMADYAVSADDVTYEWWRTVPTPKSWGITSSFIPAKGPGRGVYPVTVWYRNAQKERPCAD